MEVIKISPKVEITTTEHDPWKWEQHPNDVGLPKFITYIAGNVRFVC